MISNPKHGWCSFKLGDFTGTPSYLTDVPMDLLDAFIDYYTRGYGAAFFDEEGSEFTLLLMRHSIYIIEEKDDAKVHVFYDLSISDLTKEVITDIVCNLDEWCDDFVWDSRLKDQELSEQFKCLLEDRANELRNLIK